MNKVQEKEKMVYDYLVKTLRTEGYSPSVRDIQTALNIKSPSSVHTYLKRLEDKGLIKKDPNKSRSLRIEDSYTDSLTSLSSKIPIVGKVAAGTPILAVENYEGYIDFPMTNKKMYGQLFALRICGTSMIGAGIMDGDIVVVNRTNTAENGEIVVALVEDEATVKTFYRENGHFRLQPQNPTMEPIIVNEVYILGKVVACLRFYK